jgi:hypothetical protein
MEEAKPLRILLNGRQLFPLDPFARKNPATINDPEETLELPQGDVEIQSFTLCRQSELTKLSRVRVDIPNSMDSEWKIDVKKSSAQLPPAVKTRLKNVIERIVDGSKRTYRKRGSKLVDQERLPMWHRIQAEGQIRYRPNVDHPAFADFASILPEELRRRFINCIALVGASLPIETLHSDMAGAAEQIVPDRVDEDTLIQAVQSTFSMLLSARKEIKDIVSMMKDVDPFRSAWDDTQRIISSIIDAKEGQ